MLVGAAASARVRPCRQVVGAGVVGRGGATAFWEGAEAAGPGGGGEQMLPGLDVWM